MTMEDPLLSVYGYQLLPIATSQKVGNDREFDVLGIFGGSSELPLWLMDGFWVTFLEGGGEQCAYM